MPPWSAKDGSDASESTPGAPSETAAERLASASILHDEYVQKQQRRTCPQYLRRVLLHVPPFEQEKRRLRHVPCT